MDVINLRMLAHPLNWLFVLIVGALALMAYGAFHDGVLKSSAATSTIPD